MEFPYGKGHITFNLPKGWEPEVFRPKSIPAVADPVQEITQSLEHPLGDKRLEDFGKSASVAISISDETRPIPYDLVLPPLLKRLDKIGISRPDIRILIASGLHSPMPVSRFSTLLPVDIVHQYPVMAHDATSSDLEFLGETSRGTPVFVNPFFQKSDLRLAIGMIDPHQFVGYTGGVKCAAIGLAGAQTIEANHSMLSHPHAAIGEIANNPVRQDIEEIGKMMDVHFVVNVVLDESNQIIKAFSGNPWDVEKEGSEFCRAIYEINLPGEYDVAIASPGGYPKDLNIYQAQKALAHVTPLVRQGGDILLLAECPDGHGDEVFYQAMKNYQTPQEVVKGFQGAKFRMGMHKSFLWARSLTKARVYLYSSLEESIIYNLMVQPVQDIQVALEGINSRYVYPPKVALMPKASSTYVKRQD